MQTRGRLLLAALTATLALAVAVGVANARRFETSSPTIKITWSAFTWEDGLRMTHCPVTMEGSFHSRTFSKVNGSLIGYITRAMTDKEHCGAEGRILFLTSEDEVNPTTLPWHMRYESFAGSLPQVTEIRLQVIGLTVRGIITGGNCLYRSTVERPAVLIPRLNTTTEINRGRIEAVEFDRTKELPWVSGTTCVNSAVVYGSGPATVLGGRETVRIELVT